MLRRYAGKDRLNIRNAKLFHLDGGKWCIDVSRQYDGILCDFSHLVSEAECGLAPNVEAILRGQGLGRYVMIVTTKDIDKGEQLIIGGDVRNGFECRRADPPPPSNSQLNVEKRI